MQIKNSASNSKHPAKSTVYKRSLEIGLYTALVLYPFAGIWQWGDFTDLGYNVMEVQNFFARLNEGSLTSPRLFSYFVGAFWWKAFAGFGVLGLLAFACILISAPPSRNDFFYIGIFLTAQKPV
jgi:hypothetical protein